MFRTRAKNKKCNVEKQNVHAQTCVFPMFFSRGTGYRGGKHCKKIKNAMSKMFFAMFRARAKNKKCNVEKQNVHAHNCVFPMFF